MFLQHIAYTGRQALMSHHHDIDTLLYTLMLGSCTLPTAPCDLRKSTCTSCAALSNTAAFMNVSCLSGSKASGEQKSAGRGASGKLGNISTAKERPCAQAKTGAVLPAVYMLLPAAHVTTFPSLLHHAGC